MHDMCMITTIVDLPLSPWYSERHHTQDTCCSQSVILAGAVWDASFSIRLRGSVKRGVDEGEVQRELCGGIKQREDKDEVRWELCGGIKRREDEGEVQRELCGGVKRGEDEGKVYHPEFPTYLPSLWWQLRHLE